MTFTMVILSLMVLVATACDYSTAMGTPSDYVYPYYGLRYVSLGDYKQQPTQAPYSAPDPQGYLRYVTYMTDGSNIYRTIIRMKPGSNPAPTWARLPAQTTGRQANRDSIPISTKQSSHDARNQANQDSALTWAKLQVQEATEQANRNPTTESSKIQEAWSQANQASLETSTIQPARGRSNDAFQISMSFLEKSNQNDMEAAEVLRQLPARESISDINHESFETFEKLDDQSSYEEASLEKEPQVQQESTSEEEIHPLEDSTPSTSTTTTTTTPTTTKTTENEEEKEEDSTLVPFPVELSINSENSEMVGEESRETKVVAAPQNKEEIDGNDLTAAETFSPRYISTPYGPLAVYPLGYQPYAAQRRQMMRPMTGSLKSQNQSVHPTSTTSTERIPIKTLTAVSTANPPMVGSNHHSLSYTTGSPVPISYAYPYVRYNGQGSVVYQVPQQQYKTNQQYLGWRGMSQPSYQSTYPQGFMSYQPSVLAVRSVPYAQTAGITVKQ